LGHLQHAAQAILDAKHRRDEGSGTGRTGMRGRQEMVATNGADFWDLIHQQAELPVSMPDDDGKRQCRLADRKPQAGP
jgi:hypothetical protein